MQQLATNIMPSQDIAASRGSADRGSILDASQVSDSQSNNSSFSELYGQAHQQLAQAKQAPKHATPQAQPSTVDEPTATATSGSDDTDTVDSTLAQISAGKKLPQDADAKNVAAIDDAASVNETTPANKIEQLAASLSENDTNSLKQLLSQLLAQLQGGESGAEAKVDDSQQVSLEDSDVNGKTLEQILQAMLAALAGPQTDGEQVSQNGEQLDAMKGDGKTLEQMLQAMLAALAGPQTDDEQVSQNGEQLDAIKDNGDTQLADLLQALLGTVSSGDNDTDSIAASVPERDSLTEQLTAILQKLQPDSDDNAVDEAASQFLAALMALLPTQTNNTHPISENADLLASVSGKKSGDIWQQLSQQLSQQLDSDGTKASKEPSAPINGLSSSPLQADDASKATTDAVAKAFANDDKNAMTTDAAEKVLAAAANGADKAALNFAKELAAIDGNAVKDINGVTPQHQQMQQTQPPQPSAMNMSLRLANEQQVSQQDLIQRFAPVMRQQLLTMVKDGIQHAEIRLDPPELGAMSVKLQVRGDHTQVQFHVTQTQAKDLIEQAMPRLKDLLQQQGMNLADSQVSYGNGSGQQAGSGDSGQTGQGGGNFAGHSDETSTEMAAQALNLSDSYASGIDYYA